MPPWENPEPEGVGFFLHTYYVSSSCSLGQDPVITLSYYMEFCNTWQNRHCHLRQKHQLDFICGTVFIVVKPSTSWQCRHLWSCWPSLRPWLNPSVPFPLDAASTRLTIFMALTTTATTGKTRSWTASNLAKKITSVLESLFLTRFTPGLRSSH